VEREEEGGRREEGGGRKEEGGGRREEGGGRKEEGGGREGSWMRGRRAGRAPAQSVRREGRANWLKLAQKY
jgi:ATP-dependent RNA helicase DHX57